MLNLVSDVVTTLNLTPAYLLIIGSLIGYFRHQHTGDKVPGALSIPKDLLKSTEFNKLWTLLYVLLLPLSYMVNIVAHAVYAFLWLINTLSAVVRWLADKLYWLWNELVLGLALFILYNLWHYLVKWPYKFFRTALSTFMSSFDYRKNKSSYRTTVIAVLIASSGFILNDLVQFEVLDFSKLSLLIGALYVLTVVGNNMAETMGENPKGMRPTYAALVLTALLVAIIQALASKYMLLNQAAGVLGGVVLGVSVATWVYSILVAAAVAQFISLLVPTYLKQEGAFNWLHALRDSFISRWLKSIGSIMAFIIAYNTIGMWIYNNAREIANDPYQDFLSAVEHRQSKNDSILGEAMFNLSEIESRDTVSLIDLDEVYSTMLSVHSGNSFWQSIPTDLRDVIRMGASSPFNVSDEIISASQKEMNQRDRVNDSVHRENEAVVSEMSNILAKAISERDRVSDYDITASEDGTVEEGVLVRFGMPIPEDADNLKWRITNSEKDTIYSSTRKVLSYNFAPGNFTVHAAPINSCGTGDWTTYDITVNKAPNNVRLGGISGSTQVCSNKEYTYYAPSGMDLYVWDVPSGAEIVKDNDNSIVVKWGRSSGEVSVIGELENKRSNKSVLYVKVSAAPGTNLSDEGKSPSELEENKPSLDNYPVTIDEANVHVENALANLSAAEEIRDQHVLKSANEHNINQAKLNYLSAQKSGNVLALILNVLGKMMMIFVMSLIFSIVLNFVLIWTSAYFGTLYDLDQEGSTYFKSILSNYRQTHAGFPYVGIFTLILLILLSGFIGFEFIGQFSKYFESSEWPSVMNLVGKYLP